MVKIFFYIISVVLLMAGLILIARPKLVSDARLSDSIVIPTSILLIALGLAAAAYPSSQYFKSAPESTPDVPPTSAQKPTATPVSLAITSPADGTVVRGTFVVMGTTPPLGKDSIWLLVLNRSGELYRWTPDAPIPVASGRWSVLVARLGQPCQEIGQPFTLVLVRANPSCSDVIKNTKGVFIPTLPSGCSMVSALVVKKGAT